MIDTKEFVRALKTYGIKWCDEEQRHLIGNEVLTNKDMKIMCKNKYGEEYTKLNKPQQKAVRQSIFKLLRYGEDYE